MLNNMAVHCYSVGTVQMETTVKSKAELLTGVDFKGAFFSSNSAKTRQAALESMKSAFSSKILYEFIMERRMTLTDSIERCIKKGN